MGFLPISGLEFLIQIQLQAEDLFGVLKVPPKFNQPPEIFPNRCTEELFREILMITFCCDIYQFRMNQSIKEKMYQTAMRIKFQNREAIFQKSRQAHRNGLIHLNSYTPEQKQCIMESLETPPPEQLPPINPGTISYYRKKMIPVFQTRMEGSQVIDPHMTYESLWLLAGLNQINYKNYTSIVKQFEEDFHLYLDCSFESVRQIAIIAAGNKSIGKQTDILRVVEEDIEVIWVLVNHIIDRKISLNRLFPLLKEDVQIAYSSLFELSNKFQEETVEMIMEDQQTIRQLVKAVDHYNPTIRKDSIKVIGNILAEGKQQFAQKIHQEGLQNYFWKFMTSSDKQIQFQGYWLMSNFVSYSFTADVMLKDTKVIQKTIEIFKSQTLPRILTQICYCLVNFSMHGDKKTVFELVFNWDILGRCRQLLEKKNQQIDLVVLNLIKCLIELGLYFEEDDMNLVLNYIQKEDNFKMLIVSKAYISNQGISSIASQLQDKLVEQ